jgi:CBS domain containing-hemolysin-like protein
VVGLVHVFDLALAIADGSGDLGEDVRPMPILEGEESIASALGRMHREGLALALVRTGRGRPLQLLRLEDVVAELCGPPDRA